MYTTNICMIIFYVLIFIVVFEILFKFISINLQLPLDEYVLVSKIRKLRKGDKVAPQLIDEKIRQLDEDLNTMKFKWQCYQIYQVSGQFMITFSIYEIKSGFIDS